MVSPCSRSELFRLVSRENFRGVSLAVGFVALKLSGYENIPRHDRAAEGKRARLPVETRARLRQKIGGVMARRQHDAFAAQ
jgi:hypothetical protein